MDVKNRFSSNTMYMLGLAGFLVSFTIHFNSNLQVLLVELVSGSLAGVLLGLAKSRIDLKRYRYPIYAVVMLGALFVLIFPFTGLNCLAYVPYTAEHIVTGVEKEFIYGGCGPKPHPWYYVVQ